jgi:transcriptional regulator with XRE-family HTH domain
MASVKLKIAVLRKMKGIGQQELADALGVSFQSVSKWETEVTMPDITLLPDIAEYFDISVDELLGIKPLRQQDYLPSNTDNHDSANGREENLYKNRKYLWNNDYLEFLIKNVWKIHSPVDVIEFRCCDGYFGQQLLDAIPEGSCYTGIDNEYFIDKAKQRFAQSDYKVELIVSDLYSHEAKKHYDIAIIQVGLRHMNKPMEVLKRMIESVKQGGLIICIDVNREFENSGLYIDGLDYENLCTAFDFHKVWKTELEQEGRDYAIGMRLPFYMQQLGLYDVDIRMNDRVMFVNPYHEEYKQEVQDFIDIHDLDKSFGITEYEATIEHLMNRGVDRAQAEAFIRKQKQIAEYFKKKDDISFLKVQGLLITYGRK